MMNFFKAKSYIVKHTCIGLMISLIVLFLDQLSKYWIINIIQLPEKGTIAIMPTLNFTMVWNKAITFGLFSQLGNVAPILFTLLALCIVFFLFLWLVRTKKWWITLALGAIIGGAIGNVMDRIRLGAVIDFIHFHIGQWSWYVFNVADSAIVCGVAILLFDALFLKENKNAQE
ncbi:Lipoprotein signal peptidase [Commensalibacter sp. Nvir]|uniref:signal peptidase II n=1 Tax=Commensalibacter sp. Nvir TaxID=3069817 RepID=UPI002D50BED1|nr:Lipoprotein signal peptidase [Commensalibacter sp. Nvir]